MVSAQVKAVSTQVLGKSALSSSRNSQVGVSAGMAETEEYGGGLVAWSCRQKWDTAIESGSQGKNQTQGDGRMVYLQPGFEVVGEREGRQFVDEDSHKMAARCSKDSAKSDSGVRTPALSSRSGPQVRMCASRCCVVAAASEHGKRGRCRSSSFQRASIRPLLSTWRKS
jgi:hypothetical protein